MNENAKRNLRLLDNVPGGPGRDDESCREEDWAVIRRLQDRNADRDPDQVLADATAAIEEVRREVHARRARAAGSGR